MENRNLPVVAKKMWNLVRVMYYMMKKGISKPKLLMFDLNMLMKRGKIAGKALTKLMFHHHNNHNHSRAAHHLPFPIDPRDFEFSCTNTPAASFPFKLTKRKNNHHSHFFKCINAPATDDEVLTTVKRAFEMMQEKEAAGGSPECWDVFYTPTATPALAVYGRRTPMVRITDSPFPLREVEGKGGHVDRAAEEFISWFYDKLRKQSKMSPC